MKFVAPLLLIIAVLVSPRANAAPWSMDAAALVFTEGKALGGSLGFGYRANLLYIGGDILTHNYSEGIAGPVPIKARAKLLMPGLVLKYFIPLSPKAQVYAGGGLGYAAISTDYTANFGSGEERYSESSDNLGTQLLAGVQIPYGPAGAVKLGWRYVKAEHVNLLGGNRLKTDSHAFELGINIDF
jgi:opacity protein-like surface antigen